MDGDDGDEAAPAHRLERFQHRARAEPGDEGDAEAEPGERARDDGDMDPPPRHGEAQRSAAAMLPPSTVVTSPVVLSATA